MRVLQHGERGEAVLAIAPIGVDVERPEPGTRSGDDADHRAWMLLPPTSDLLRIRARCAQTARDQRPFGRRIAWEHRPPASGIGQRGGAKLLDEGWICMIRADAHHGRLFWGAVTRSPFLLSDQNDTWSSKPQRPPPLLVAPTFSGASSC